MPSATLSYGRLALVVAVSVCLGMMAANSASRSNPAPAQPPIAEVEPEAIQDEDSVTSRPLAGACPDHYHLSYLLSHFIDIDFIQFVLALPVAPKHNHIVDIGVYTGGEIVQMARTGFTVDAYEPNPNRYRISKAEIDQLPADTRRNVRIRQLAVSDDARNLHFQLAGVDSHAYVVDNSTRTELKRNTVVVQTIPMLKVLTRNTFFVKVDTQGFDTRIVNNLLDALEQNHALQVTFIQFEFTPFMEVTRSKRTKADHKLFFRRLIDAGYDLYQGAAVQPWLRNHRGTYGRSPLALLAVDPRMPTCVDEYVDHMHHRITSAIHPGKTSHEHGSWADILAVRRSSEAPYHRHTGWVLARKM